MRIDIVSDVICPWCYIGKRRLERALAQRSEIPASLSWRAFQLNPDMPADGMNRERYVQAKFGSAAQAARIYAQVAEVGATEGIAFAFERIRRTPNTIDAHRLIRYASRRGAADPVVESLFQAYFCDGRDIGDRTTLADIAGEAGLDPISVATFLESGDQRDVVVAEDASARRIGVTGVPCFIVEGGYAISGAQEPEFFFPLFDLVLNKATAVAD